MLESFNEGTFAPLLNTEFTLYPEPARAVKVELVEVNGDGDQKVPGLERFSLVFRGPLKYMIQQQTVPLEHEALGLQHLFLVPVGREADGFRYEAVFNRPSADRSSAGANSISR